MKYYLFVSVIGFLISGTYLNQCTTPGLNYSCADLQKELDSVKLVEVRLIHKAAQNLHECDSINIIKKKERDSLLQYLVHYKTVCNAVKLDLALVLKSRKVVDGKVIYPKLNFLPSWLRADLQSEL